jgi:hypothetical protein
MRTVASWAEVYKSCLWICNDRTNQIDKKFLAIWIAIYNNYKIYLFKCPWALTANHSSEGAAGRKHSSTLTAQVTTTGVDGSKG